MSIGKSRAGVCPPVRRSDVVAHYDRLLGLGMGFTISPYYVSVTGWAP